MGNPTVGAIAEGSYVVCAENHSKCAYRRNTQVNGMDVMVYFWDQRDGPSFCGWWIGPKIGGDQAWAYNPDIVAQTPPTSGWKIPYNGPVDQTMLLSPVPGTGGCDMVGKIQENASGPLLLSAPKASEQTP